MSDATIQARIQTLIQALETFDAADVTLGDLRILGRGSPPYAVIWPGTFDAARPGDWAQVAFAWRHPVLVYERFSGDDMSGITTARQNVVDQINAYPTLNGLSGVSLATVVVGEDLTYLWLKGQPTTGLPQLVVAPVVVQCLEEVSYSGSGEFTT